MNILTFDIEEWFLEKTYHGGRQERYKIFDGYLERILNLLDERNLKGTFFCVGGMGKDFPDVVRKIDERGHEIGCHSYKHTWLNKMTQEEVKEDTRTAVDALEQCIGKKVISYRAPAFSIGESNRWTFEVLSECGIHRDASVFPAERDFGGFALFGQKRPTMVYYNRVQMKEFPICTTHLMSREIAYSGGGYFRFFPLNYVKRTMAKNDYNMCYFHIADLIPESNGVKSKEDFESYYKESGTLINRYKRYIKSNLGKKSAYNKLIKLISTEDFVNLEQADNMINWDGVSPVVL